MRWVGPLVLLFSMPWIPMATAHSAGFPHVNPMIVELEPGEERWFDLEFEEDMEGGAGDGKFGAGWVFLLSGTILEGNGSVDVLLHSEEGFVSNWTLEASHVTQYLSGQLPIESVYFLGFQNPSDEPVRFVFFYDQSCNCLSKPIPPDVPQGMVVFQVDVQKGDTWRAAFPEPPVHELLITMAVREDERSRWPQDFTVLDTSLLPTDTGPENRTHVFEFTADRTGTHYFFAQSVEADLSQFNTSDPYGAALSVMIFPQFEKVSEASSPLDPWVAVVAIALAIVWRGRRRPE